MKNPLFLRKVGYASLCQLALCLGASAAHIDFDTSAIYESYDRNPLGEMVGKPSGGYGVAGNYNFQGNSEAVAKAAFKIVEGGLAFGTYNSTAGRSVQVNADANGTGVGILVDGGKAWGDTAQYRFDMLYCSYLVNFSQASNVAGTRAEVRTSTAATGGDQFQVHVDGSAVTEGSTNGNGKIQPALAYKGATYDRAVNPVTNSLQVNETYMMIGRFNNAGNVLGVTPTGTWNLGDSTITVSSNSNIVVGQQVLGVGIAENSIVTGISSTAITLSKPTIAAGPAGTKLDFVFLTNTNGSAIADYLPPAAGVTTTDITLISNTGNIAVGMVATGTGIPVNTTVLEYTASPAKVKLSSAVTATVTSGTIIFRSVTPLSGTWTLGATTITVSSNPGIQAGQGVTGNGIAPGTLVISPSGNQITLSKPTIANSTAGNPVYFHPRTASCSLFTLSLAQYNHLVSLASQQAKEVFLDTATMGTAANQVTVRIIGTPTTTGSIEFGQGRYIHLIAQGGNPINANDPARQIYKMDELRFGFTLRSVTQPAAMLTVPSADPAAYDDAGKRFFYPFDNGYGWKSGFYEVEETGSPQGAILLNVAATDAQLTPGSTDYMWINPRSALDTDQGTRRRPDPMIVDMTKPYTVTFDFQLKSGFSTFTAFEDRIQFGADGQVTATGAMATGANLGPNPTRPNIPTAGGTNISWMTGVIGGQATGRNIFPGRWYFYDFNGQSLAGSSPPNYFVGENMVLASDDTNSQPEPDTDQIPGITTGDSQSAAGGIYSFKIEVNPQTFTYRGTIIYRPKSSSPANEIKRYTRGGLKFRDNADANTLFWGISKSANESRIFALDNMRVSPGVDFFPDWVGSFASITASGDKVRSADPDTDGRKNFLEYALDGNPSNGIASGKEIHGVNTIASSPYHTLTVPVRSGFSFTAAAAPNTGDLESNFTNNEGIKYRIEGSYDLVNWDATVVEVTPAITPATVLSPSPGYAYKTFRLGQPISTSQPKGFLRVVVDSTK